jgi:hypothetical protein
MYHLGYRSKSSLSRTVYLCVPYGSHNKQRLFIKYAIGLDSFGMIYLPSFMKIGTGVQAILRFCLRNLRGRNVDITYATDL